MTDDLDLLFARAASQLPDVGDRLPSVLARRRHRLRRRALAATAAVIVLGAGATAVVVPDHHRRTATLGAADERVEASGRVVAIAGHPVVLCADQIDGGAFVLKPHVDPCGQGVPLAGVDLGHLEGRAEVAGAVEGYATLAGRLDDGTLVVDHQGRWHEHPAEDEVPAITSITLPCPTPAGGWRDDPELNGTLNAYVATHPSAVVVALAHPAGTTYGTWLLVTEDPDSARRDLAQPADTLCVARSRYPSADYHRVERDPLLRGLRGGVLMSGDSVDSDGTPYLSAKAVRPTPELDADLAQYPDGLVRMTYFLQPAVDPPDPKQG